MRSEIVQRIPGDVVLCELGSGSGTKTRWILEALSRRRHTYYFPDRDLVRPRWRCAGASWPISIRSESSAWSANTSTGCWKWRPGRRDGQRILVLFLGSTIGNFSHPADVNFLRECSDDPASPAMRCCWGPIWKSRFLSSSRRTTIRWESRPRSI